MELWVRSALTVLGTRTRGWQHDYQRIAVVPYTAGRVTADRWGAASSGQGGGSDGGQDGTAGQREQGHGGGTKLHPGTVYYANARLVTFGGDGINSVSSTTAAASVGQWMATLGSNEAEIRGITSTVSRGAPIRERIPYRGERVHPSRPSDHASLSPTSSGVVVRVRMRPAAAGVWGAWSGPAVRAGKPTAAGMPSSKSSMSPLSSSSAAAAAAAATSSAAESTISVVGADLNGGHAGDCAVPRWPFAPGDIALDSVQLMRDEHSQANAQARSGGGERKAGSSIMGRGMNRRVVFQFRCRGGGMETWDRGNEDAAPEDWVVAFDETQLAALHQQLLAAATAASSNPTDRFPPHLPSQVLPWGDRAPLVEQWVRAVIHGLHADHPSGDGGTTGDGGFAFTAASRYACMAILQVALARARRHE